MHPVGETKPARELYAGDYWRSLQDTKDVAKDFDLDVWVMSAGYGLIREDAQIEPYSATLSPGHADYVAEFAGGVTRSVAARRWWASLAQWIGPEADQPRDLTQLAARRPADAYVFLVSPPYLSVLSDNLDRLVCSVGAAHVIVFSAGLRKNLAGGVALSYDASLQRVVGGGLNSLNVRAFKAALVRSGSIARVDLQAALHELADQAGGRQQYKRSRLTDEQLRAVVADDMRQTQQRSWSAALRRLRDDKGLACEQKRFRSVYRVMSSEMDQARI
jgi:hypothetical protein